MGQNLTLFVNHIYLLQFLVFIQQFESTHPTRKGHVIKILKLGRHKKYFCYITELFIYNWKSSTFVAQKEIFLFYSIGKQFRYFDLDLDKSMLYLICTLRPVVELLHLSLGSNASRHPISEISFGGRKNFIKVAIKTKFSILLLKILFQ